MMGTDNGTQPGTAAARPLCGRQTVSMKDKRS